MSSDNISPLSEELTGIWALRPLSEYHKQIFQLFRFCTVIIFSVLFIKVILQIGLVPVALLLVSGTIILVLELYSARFPHIAIPLNQLVVFICLTYLHLHSLFSQQSVIFEAINYSILPDLIELFLGIIILIRIIIGIELIRLFKRYQHARIPLSRFPLRSLQAFEINLQLTSSEFEYSEESSRFRLKTIFSSVIISICLLIILLIPLWLVLLGFEGIYPYIIVIPFVLVTLLILVYFPPRSLSLNEND
jgi:hypothetical protein